MNFKGGQGNNPSYFERCSKNLKKSDQIDYVLVFITFQGSGGAWIKYPRKDMAVTFSYSLLASMTATGVHKRLRSRA